MTPAVQRILRPMLAIAGAMSGAFVIYLIVDMLRPRRDPESPVIGLFAHGYPALLRTVVVAVFIGWAVVALIWLWVLIWPRVLTGGEARGSRSRIAAVVTLVALLVPFVIYPVTEWVTHPVTLLACIPSTGFALWLIVTRMQPLHRMPPAMPLAAFGWGALIAPGCAAMLNIFYLDAAFAYHGGGIDLAAIMHKVYAGIPVEAGFIEEAVKGSGVLLLYLLYRRHFDGVVSGVVLGAAVGLGFNLAESVEYMSSFNGATAGFQYWMRQSIGLLAAHTAFSALVGAGFGAASMLSDRRSRLIAIGCGYLAGAGGHLANDAMLSWLGNEITSRFPSSQVLDLLVLQPVTLVLLQGPFVVLYLLLFRSGVRAQAAGLSAALQDEARSGRGAVTDAEVPVLLSVVRRRWLALLTLRRYGLATCRNLLAVQAMQLELANARWQRDRTAHGADIGVAVETDETLRSRVLDGKRRHLELVTTGRTTAAEAVA